MAWQVPPLQLLLEFNWRVRIRQLDRMQGVVADSSSSSSSILKRKTRIQRRTIERASGISSRRNWRRSGRSCRLARFGMKKHTIWKRRKRCSWRRELSLRRHHRNPQREAQRIVGWAVRIAAKRWTYPGIAWNSKRRRRKSSRSTASATKMSARRSNGVKRLTSIRITISKRITSKSRNPCSISFNPCAYHSARRSSCAPPSCSNSNNKNNRYNYNPKRTTTSTSEGNSANQPTLLRIEQPVRFTRYAS